MVPVAIGEGAIREATLADIPRIVELGTLWLREGPYAELVPESPERFTRLAEQIVSGLGKVLLWEANGQVTGLLAFLVVPHFLTDQMTASELIWYVLPASRPEGAGMRLFWAAQDLARELGAKRMEFTAPTEQVGALYRRCGYTQMEVHYQRSL